ncbi:MAG: type IV secretion system protein (plasmid) [Burkholderia sp.]
MAVQAQVMVEDPGVLANTVQQIAQMTQQITTLKSQLQTAESQYSALTGSSGLGSLVSGSTGLLKGNLPQDWTHVYQDAMNSSSSITPSASSMLGQFKSQIDGMGRGDALKFVQQQLQMKGAYDRQWRKRLTTIRCAS